MKTNFQSDTTETFITVTSIGENKPGVLNAISHVISKNKANVELQRISALDREYAMILIVSSKNNAVDQLIKELADLTNKSIIVQARKYPHASLIIPKKEELGQIVVGGADHRGILEEFTSMLYKNKINIESLQQDMTPAPNSGSPMFELIAEITIPENFDEVLFRQHLANIEHELSLDILFNYPFSE